MKKICKDDFGILDVQKNIDSFNRNYFEKYDLKNNSNDIIFTNGNMDHWAVLSIIDSNYLHNQSHGADFANQNTPDVQAIRFKIYDQIKKWALGKKPKGKIYP